MFSVRWRKVIRDTWGNMARSILVVLSIAVGVFGVGMLASARVNLSRELNDSYASIQPAHAELSVEPFDNDLVESVRRVPGVAAAEGRQETGARLFMGADREYKLTLQVIPDFGNMRVNQVRAVSGAAVYANQPYYAQLTQKVGRAAWVQVITQQHDAASQSEMASVLEKHFENAGIRVAATGIVADTQARVTQLLDVITAILSVASLLLATVGALGLAGTMSVNVLERTREIGVMRAVGASNGRRRIFCRPRLHLCHSQDADRGQPLGVIGVFRRRSFYPVGRVAQNRPPARVSAHERYPVHRLFRARDCGIFRTMVFP
jgi:hypothetical protein